MANNSPSMRSSTWGLLVGICVSVIIFLSGIVSTGLISDDYVLLANINNSSWHKPLENSHFSIVIFFIYQLIDQEFPIAAIKCLAIGIHILNIILLYYWLKPQDQIRPQSKSLATIIFAAAASGIEAIAWTAAFGYLITGTFILIALILQQRPLNKLSYAVFITLIQALAILAWEWGFLLTPLLICKELFSEKPRNSFLELIAIYASALIIIITALIVRQNSGMQTGYTSSVTLGDSVGVIYKSTQYFILPFQTKTTYSHILFKLPFLIFAIIALYQCLRSREKSYLLCSLLLCLLPIILFSSPSSRYLYIGMIFFAGLIAQLPNKKIYLIPTFILAVSHCFIANQQSAYWKLATNEAASIKEKIEAVYQENPNQDLIIINLPDNLATSIPNWRPYLWRNGINAIDAKFTPVATKGTDFSKAHNNRVIVMDRKDIETRFPNSLKFEFIQQADKRFVLKEFLE